MAEPEMMETVGDVLNAAADVIEKRGWTRGTFCDAAGNVCTMGAINASLSGRPNGVGTDAYAMQARRQAAMGIKFLAGAFDVASWNDEMERTKPEVLRTLRLAAWVYDDQPLSTPVVRHG